MRCKPQEIGACLFVVAALVVSSLPAQQPGTITGKVLDAVTKAPLAGATVSIDGTALSQRTNTRGAFAITGVASGQHTLTANLIGYSPLRKDVSVGAGETVEVELTIERSPYELSGVVVTATRTRTEMRDVPAPVDVVSSATIQQSGATTMMQAVQNVPEVTAAAFGENFQSIQLRGLPRLGNENETVLILLDGVPQTDARNSAQLTTLPIDVVDRIEVVKGPTSSLYGRTAVAGVVNIITRDPTATSTFDARTEAGAFGYVHAELSAAGPLSSSGNTGYFVSWLADRHDGFQDQPISRRQSSVFGKLSSALGPRTQLVVTANYAANRGGTPAPVPIANGKLLSDSVPAFSFYTNLNLPYAEYNQEDARAMARLSQTLSDRASLTNTFGYRYSFYNFNDDGDVLSPPASGSTNVILFPFTHHRNENNYYDDLHIEGSFGGKGVQQRLVAGASIEQNTGQRTSILPYTDTVTFGVPVDYLNPTYPGRYDLKNFDIGGSSYTTTFYSLYAQDELNMSERLHLSAGARYDINHLTSEPVAPATGGAVTGTFHKFSPKLGVSYRVLNSPSPTGTQFSVYAQYAGAFLPPVAAIDPQTVRTSPPSPETITNYEAGFKGTALHSRLNFDASGFYLKRDGIPIEVRTGGNAFAITNGGVQEFPGVEVGVGARVTSSLTLRANYAYYGAKFGNFKYVVNGTDVDLTGNRISLSPHNVADLRATVTRSTGFVASLMGHYEGSRFLNNANTFLMKAYFLTIGRAGWQWAHYNVAVDVENIFDVKYLTDGDTSTAQHAFAGSRRRVFAEVGATF